MTTARLEHFITFTNAVSFDEYLEEYRRAGFVPAETTARHPPGLRNGFVSFGPDYIEFAWVEDEDLFEQGVDNHPLIPGLDVLRAAVRPWGIGLVTDDVQALHDAWEERGYALPPVFSAAARDSEPDAQPIWSFQAIPDEFLPGVRCFALTYHTAPKSGPRTVQVAPNTTYAIAGVTFVSAAPEARAQSWQRFLAPAARVQATEHGYQVIIRPHVARWITPAMYQQHFGRAWKPAPHPAGELAVLHLLALDLDEAERATGRAGRTTVRLPDKHTGHDMLLVLPDPRDGFTFAITERPIEDWLEQRSSLTGETFEVVHTA